MKLPFPLAAWFITVIAALFAMSVFHASAQTRPLGIDVSYFQGSEQNPPTSINWTSVKAAGISFAWVRSSEGTNYNDPDFAVNMANAKAAGVIVGAYHFADYTNIYSKGLPGATNEANHFWSVASNYLKGGNVYLMPMLDMEEGLSPYTQTTLTAWVNAWCNTVSNKAAAAGIKLKPFIYASSSHAASYFTTGVTNWSADIAAWSASANPQTGAPSFTPWPAWTAWQYYDAATVSGIHGNCDVDVFNGTMTQLLANYVITTLGPNILTSPASVTVAAGTNVTLAVSATSSHPITYQWMLDGTAIPSATASQFTITNAQTTNAGDYTVLASDSIGSTLSGTAFVSVIAPLTNAPTGGVIAPTGLVNWFTFDGNVKDIIGTETTTLQGGLNYVPGEDNLAMNFDGQDTLITTSAGDLAVPWTVSVWVYHQTTPQNSAGLLEDGLYSLKLEQYSFTHDVGLSILGTNDYVFNPAYSLPVNTWTHLAFVGTSSSTTLYVNGVSKATLAVGIPLPRKYIGGAYVSSSAKYVDFVLGNLDELMIFNRNLSVAEIQGIYNAGSAGIIRAPIITGTATPATGEFQLGLEGLTGRNFSVYSSTDMSTWTKVGTVVNTTGTNQYTDMSATNMATFYRVSQP